VHKGKSSVVIGARSALFTPLRKMGIIVIDEEHDASYKQSDLIPKYNARDTAIVLGNIYKCPVVLGSATPSVESMYNAQTGKYKLLNLPNRVDDAKMPKISLVNITSERKKKRMENILSKTLLDKIEERLKRNEGVIILQNRRGFSTQIYCSDCGDVEICDNCSVPMVFHINNNLIQCHYCGLVKDVPGACTHCGSLAIKYFGTGTERVEDELEYYLKGAAISRIDSDSITKKLWLPDFRADERTFQLLTQVSGRAGRSKAPGEVIIQTQNEKHFALQKVLTNDYKGFYQKEVSDREKMGYPPFTHITLIETKDASEKRALGAITDFYNQLKKYGDWLNISKPAPAVIARLKGSYRFHIMIKSSKGNDPGGGILRKAIMDSFVEFIIL
jgi:primosomal protein N' (replication factor Y)